MEITTYTESEDIGDDAATASKEFHKETVTPASFLFYYVRLRLIQVQYK
jgi:hypothetical protein